MPLRPEDVVRKSFRSSRLRRGYEEEEVDAFLEEVVVELRRLQAEIDELKATSAAPVHDKGRDRVALEEEQLARIRQERAELVADLERLQERYDRLSVEVAEVGTQRAAVAEVSADTDGELEPAGRHRGAVDKGATAVEYAIMASLIAAVIVGVVATLGLDVAALYQDMVDNWP